MTWHDVAPNASRDQVRDWIIADLKECTAHGERFGVIVGVQNHGDFLQTGDQVLELVDGVDSDWCGVIVDTGYFNHAPDPYAEMVKVAPYAVNWQVKQTLGEDTDPPLDLVRLMRIVRSSGYSGFLPIETLGRRSVHSRPRNGQATPRRNRADGLRRVLQRNLPDFFAGARSEQGFARSFGITVGCVGSYGELP